MANKAKRHTHKYYRAEVSWGQVWACALPDCNHYWPPHMDALMNGKRSICWKCNQPMLLSPLNLSMPEPICHECQFGELPLELTKVS